MTDTNLSQDTNNVDAGDGARSWLQLNAPEVHRASVALYRLCREIYPEDYQNGITHQGFRSSADEYREVFREGAGPVENGLGMLVNLESHSFTVFNKEVSFRSNTRAENINKEDWRRVLETISEEFGLVPVGENGMFRITKIPGHMETQKTEQPS